MGNLHTNFDRIVLAGENANASQFMEYANKHAIATIHVTKKSDRDRYNLDFLNELIEPERIKKLVLPAKMDGLEALRNFSGLEYLAVYPDRGQAVDLACFPKLKKLFTNCPGGFVHGELCALKTLSLEGTGCLNGLERFGTVSELYLNRTGALCLQDAAPLNGLKRLVLSHTRMQSLNGIGRFRALRELHIEYAPRLERVNEVSQLSSLISLTMCHCPKLADIADLGGCASLKRVELERIGNSDLTVLGNIATLEKAVLTDCGSIPSLKFIEKLKNLYFLSFVDTDVLDGDLTPCLRLKYAGTLDKRHYNFKSNELPGHEKFRSGFST